MPSSHYQIVAVDVVEQDEKHKEKLRGQKDVVLGEVHLGILILLEDREPDKEAGDHELKAVDEVELEEALAQSQILVHI